MRVLTAGVAAVLLILAGPIARKAPTSRGAVPEPAPLPARTALHTASTAVAPDIEPEDLTAVVQRYCVVCHNDQMRTGNLSLEGFDVANPVARAATAEKMIRKLQVRMMPPPGMPRPGGDTLDALITELETRLDRAAAANPTPGIRSFQRLNRPEYENAIRELLGLEIDVARYLQPDTKSNSFDNIVDVQLMSPTLLDSYLRAASEISRAAIGNADATVSQTTYLMDEEASQGERVPGAPIGTRGGLSVIHNFPADGRYTFQIGGFPSRGAAMHAGDRPEQVEFSIDGERVAVVDFDWYLDMGDGGTRGVESIRTEPVFIRGGPHQLSAAFIASYEGPTPDVVKPDEMTLNAVLGRYGTQVLAHLRDVVIVGPFNPTGVSENPVRQRIFTCRPTVPSEVTPCARSILTDLATRAFRRPVRPEEIEALMSLYEQGAEEGGFEVGIRNGLELILASPHFVFRFEKGADPGRVDRAYPVSDFDLASRLSFFLWGSPPDEELLSLARQGRLSDRLEAQTRRMLADPRSEALATRFAAQWLRLGDIAGVVPTMYIYPDYHSQLGEAMRRETELFFYNLVKEDLSVLDLFTADYTFVNEPLARHYGIPGIAGPDFQRVQYPDESRRGLLGHASVLMLTSLAPRTSPVLRGKYVMEVILGTPPPPPPPGVPPLDETEGSTEEGRILTTRERMEIHRANPTCNACHRFMDPVGLALDNFDVIGQWRTRENGAPLDTRGEMWDGTPVSSPAELQRALLRRPVRLLQNFTENMMAYALGRRIEYYDMPAIRKIVTAAERDDYRTSSFVLGVVNSDAFRMRRAETMTESSDGGQ